MDVNFWGKCADCGADIELSINSFDNIHDRVIVDVPTCDKCTETARTESYDEGFADAKTKYEQE